ncbi:MAG: HEPN domain-containing protein [Okeania sp. SIO2C2]|uniref:HEPN domain-containing protein n=1 Tax=Okeania sp. SIO2C2 TaxID=2607787 RepID=UPI0013BB8EF8|nr:HEPN domain-containing protein [Okeania sp. SIO2C2]NEP89265.1 HEPN domain-containing protein [Okeania sp. SIO2C2]
MEESFIQAAGRHLHDAEILLVQNRWDNAIYLAGYVVECTFKVIVEQCINNRTCQKFGHDLTELQDKSIERLRTIYPILDCKLPISRTNGTILVNYHPQRRYFNSGLWNEKEAKEAVQRAAEIYNEIIPRLILDGKISSEEL